jgi:uncharacterized phage-associated protein
MERIRTRGCQRAVVTKQQFRPRSSCETSKCVTPSLYVARIAIPTSWGSPAWAIAATPRIAPCPVRTCACRIPLPPHLLRNIACATASPAAYVRTQAICIHPEQHMFDERRLAQMAAFFADRAGQHIDVLKLMKLLYLADRASMERYSAPISFDHMVSMEHGPVLSQALNFCSGFSESAPGGWEEWMHDRAAHIVELKQPVTREKLDELSEADIEVLQQVWDRFGSMSGWELRNWTHDHCPEWRDPHGSSLRIRYSDVFRAIGKSPEEARELDSELRDQERVNRVLSS